MAGVLVDVLLERLATIVLDKVEREIKLVTGVKNEVESLARNLEAIQAVLEDAERRQVTEATVRRWLSELSEVSFEMDNVLDEWCTEILKQQMEKEEAKGESSKTTVAPKKKVCFPSPSSCFCFGQVDKLMLRRDIADRIKDLNEKLALIAKEKNDFSFQKIKKGTQLHERQKTTSLPDITFGREEEKEKIVSKLLSESSEGKRVPLIIPVVGMGGLGKTTLAQLVYNDERVKSHFDKRVWVCVSDPFEEIKIAKAIIEGLNSSSNSNELQTLMQHIYELVEGQKFFLVMDDVWSPKSSQLEELMKALRNGAMGSRVLVTARKEEVATLMKATTELISLKELGEAFCLSLFYYNADMDESSVSKDYSDIGVELVRRCNGLPLAAKTLGSLMRNKKNIREWRAILNSKTWELKEIEHEVFQPLLLSYHDLDPAIKRCLLYCVLFPKDYVYRNNTLIELWMSQDYLNANGSKEKTGQNYFDNLVTRSFFQDIKVDDENGVTKCKIHDIVHDFLQYLTKSEYLLVDFELDASERKELSNDKVHHLTLVHTSEGDSLVPFLVNYKKLRSFIIMGSTDSLEPIFDLKCLRTIFLSSCEYSLVEVPKMICGLIHLRYLDFSGNSQLAELPMSGLYNLQTLRLVYCKNLKKLDVSRLINLRHLYVSECGAQGSIEGIEKLTNLHTLDEFEVPDGDEGNKLEHLKDLNQLQGTLHIDITGDPKVAENVAILVNKAHLFRLILSSIPNGEIMDSLEPHPDLEYLEIRYYGGEALSHWLGSLHSLRALTLKNCHELEVLPPLGKLKSLESLEINNWAEGVKKVGIEFLGIDGQTSSSNFISFPKLKQLSISGLFSWEEWEGVENFENNNITIMPCLSQLAIRYCQKLKALPDFLWKTPLQELIFYISPYLENLYREETGEWAKISHIHLLIEEEMYIQSWRKEEVPSPSTHSWSSDEY